MFQLGEKIKFTLFGSSHGPYVGCILEGIPVGMTIDSALIKKYMELRKPSAGIGTPRKEPDIPEIVSGIEGSKSDGTPILIRIPNTNVRDSDYSKYGYTPRPGHADLPAAVKGLNCLGGGVFSGRMTAAIVAGGSIARQFISSYGINISAHTRSIGGVADAEPRDYGQSLASEVYPTRACTKDLDSAMRREIERASEEDDSVGGVTECVVSGLPIGFGGIWFEALDSELARAIFSIPACKGIEFGEGFSLARMRGSESNDQYFYDNGVKTASNNMGGVVGGMSNGAPLLFRTVFKPTPSISRLQRTVDLRAGINTDIRVGGRHDPCIVPRAAVVVESMTALVIADQIGRGF
ncbi:MAG: chorismate synthase [Methanomassiliicoccaceae archaeon]|nr:chorismate synthase [Methanomassiliicoccaceae archaeon]